MHAIDTQTDRHNTAQSFFKLAGKRCVVTGSAAEIGQAIAERFAVAGVEVWPTEIDGQAVQARGREIDAGGGHRESTTLDVRDDAACVAFDKRLLHVWSTGVDVLVNNAGVGFKGTINQTGIEDFHRLNRVNVEGVFNLTSETQPVGRMPRPKEIAAAAHYLASDDASFITGTALHIACGFSAGK